LDPDCGTTQPRRVARIDNDACIGCTKCIAACPVDAIVGAAKHQHHVIADRCSGCDLCLPPCPVDCITMNVVEQDWSDADARRGRSHHRAKLARLERQAGSPLGPAEASAAADGVSPAAAGRDPLLMLSTPEEKARRLAAILSRARAAGAR
jgi:electron transport complex protein RnfB